MDEQNTKLTPDEIRSRIVEEFKKFEPHAVAYHDYAERMAALNIEYHHARLTQAFPGAPFEELTLAGTLDARETPKSLDTKLAQLHEAGIVVKRIIFDRTKATYSLFI